MSERRMFAKTIIDSDAFLDMPLSTQSLYFHLSMRADDDGFVNNPRKIQRTINASDDDLKILAMKNFIIPFESGIVVIKHWKIHNYLRCDRYKPTVYQEELSLLTTKENKVYTLGIPNDNQCETQVSIGEVSIDKLNPIVAEKPAPSENEQNFEKIYQAYRKNVKNVYAGKSKAFTSYNNWLKGKKINGKTVKLTHEQIIKGFGVYYNQCIEKNIEEQFRKNIDTLMNNIIDYVFEN